MSRPRRPVAADLAAPLLAAAASFFTMLSWDGLSDDASAFLVPLFGLALGVAVLGTVLRAAGLPRPVVPLVQLLAVALLLHWSWASGGALGGWLPTSESVASLRALLDQASLDIARYAAPVPREAAGFPFLMLLVGSVVVLCVDALATSLRRAPLAGLPLLAVFTVPVTLLGGVSWLTFSLAAAAFVLLLAAEHAARLGTWGRSLAGSASATFADPPLVSAVHDSQPHQVRLGTLLPTAGRIGLAGIGAAVLVPLVVPVGSGLIDGDGSGVGIGDDDVALDNPFVDLRRDLVRGPDLDLVELRTDDPDPAYLRLTVLDEYDGDLWRPSERDIPESNRVEGPLPEPPGLDAGTPRTEHGWSLRLTESFAMQWLPTPYPATSVEVPGDWRYDFDTLDLVGADEDVDPGGLAYTLTALELQPDPRALVSTTRAPQGLQFSNTRLPQGVPPWVEELAVEVTDGSSSSFERAVTLQQWFREDGGFEYSTRPDSGNGVDDLTQFLTDEGPDGRVGYCEQFAAAMALMARTLDIPARVAVGFLRPDPGPTPGTFVYSAHDLHAWPELYFQGAGWVRFEPTPQDRAAEPPPYTVGEVPQTAGGPTPSTSETNGGPSDLPSDQAPQDGTAADADAGALPSWLPAAAVVALLAAVALAPRLARGWLRRRRYAAADPDRLVESVWAEVRATALDLGMRWDDGATLRNRAKELVPSLRPGDGEPLRALERLVLLLERSRYSRTGLPGEHAEEAPRLGRVVVAALLDAARPRARRRATWLPASLWRRRPAEGRRTPGAAGTGTSAPGRSDRVSV